MAERVNLFSAADLADQRAFFAARPDLSATPLHRATSLAGHLGVADLLIKDETARFGLNAFKAAGAMFAVATLRQRGQLRAGDLLVCASEGNHGRAVARAARETACRARVYMSASVAPARVHAIEGEGAEVVLVEGTYDEAVRVMAREAAERGWLVISDTSWPGYTAIPRLIMLGYTRIFDEIAQERSANTPSGRERPGLPADVVFVPAGVGGLLAAVACWADLEYGSARPRIVGVEPVSAACVQASMRAGRPEAVPGPFDTVMGGLRCGEMAPAVFPAVRSLVDALVAIEDEFAFEAMRLLARPAPPDVAVRSGASGAAALGGLLAMTADPALAPARRHVGLGVDSRVLVVVTEGVTDPAVFDAALARP
jgi:diaminopropionate ammonia-lyase